MLFGLFWAQFIIGAAVPKSAHDAELIIVAVMYLTFAVVVLVRDRGRVPRLLRDGFRTSYADLASGAGRAGEP